MTKSRIQNSRHPNPKNDGTQVGNVNREEYHLRHRLKTKYPVDFEWKGESILILRVFYIIKYFIRYTATLIILVITCLIFLISQESKGPPNLQQLLVDITLDMH